MRASCAQCQRFVEVPDGIKVLGQFVCAECRRGTVKVEATVDGANLEMARAAMARRRQRVQRRLEAARISAEARETDASFFDVVPPAPPAGAPHEPAPAPALQRPPPPPPPVRAAAPVSPGFAAPPPALAPVQQPVAARAPDPSSPPPTPFLAPPVPPPAPRDAPFSMPPPACPPAPAPQATAALPPETKLPDFRRSSSKAPLFLGGAASLVLVVGIVAWAGSSSSDTPTPVASAPEPTAPKPENTPVARPAPPPPQPAATTQPAPGGAFDKAAAQSALLALTDRASSCRRSSDPKGVARIRITFEPSGKATKATVEKGTFSKPPLSTCLAKLFKTAEVPPFQGDPVEITHSVVIR